jgi:hypothetical protein
VISAHDRIVAAGDALLLVMEAIGEPPLASSAWQDTYVETTAVGFLDGAGGS